MFADMKQRASNKPVNLLAVETAVVDLSYPNGGGNDALKHEFFAHLKELIQKNGGVVTFADNPRPGDMVLVMAEDFDDALISFDETHHAVPESSLPENPTLYSRENWARVIRQHLFGTPKPTAGGSLANTFHALVNAGIDGQKLAGGHFVTAVGEEETAQTFIDSLSGNIHASRAGRQMECHVFPMDNDRILIATPAKHNPAERYISSQQFAHPDATPAGRDRILLGGFLFFTPAFPGIYDAIVTHLEGLEPKKRPQMVLTAAAQTIASNQSFRDRIAGIATLANTIVHANTGEFRRLLNMDIDWRKPFDADFAGLRGQALEKAKDAHIPYKAAKDAANAAAIAVAVRQARDLAGAGEGPRLRYVVTNGAREIFIVDAHGCQTFHPNKVSRAEIVNTVGAGDNFAAGYQLGDIYNLDTETCVRMASDFAAAIIKSADARLDAARTERVIAADPSDGEVVLLGALSHLGPALKETLSRKPAWIKDVGVWPWPPGRPDTPQP